ncbi:hypothetical protein HBI56_091020 [Parastagonospora nodorum]|nr:hypothetical protein HBH42_159080 [Parastagonospora nodorum]KAH4222415.1 hypothetical protein HBI06_148560 [Parastagonospora nodorum]KAH4228492.1 hypothetical protein HBI05_205990 [Parastagonospora nodorum]KAH4266544.1 hypothetical protein HBI03_078590 [Parastagonospora nodorum]KAH4275762.1 hypothetical protein HBI04_125770 [Parastagonospora nodorum]
MSSTFADAKATRRYIQDDLTDKVLHVHSPTDAYIRYEDILHAWSGRTTIQKVLFRVELSQADIDTIHRRLLRFLSILVYVGANDFLSGPRSNFFHPNGEPVYEDKRFPVHNNDRDVLPIESLTIRTRFLNDQYIFFPEYVHESSQIRMIDVRLRLPFQEIVRNTASGAYGTVDKVGISPNYFITVERNRNNKVKLVACKRFHVSNPRRDSMRELKNLEILKESITSHANIRIHLAVLLYKGEHLILLPWADHHDLDHFLAEGFDFGGKPVYDFAEVFPLANNGALIKDVCVQMYRIADALAWLHEGIVAPVKEGRLYFAHMDLKPNNILIDKNNSSVVSVVGKWVLTDFGISAFKEDDGSSTSDLPTIRDVYERLTIQTTPRREAGAYQPPEVQGVRRRNSGNEVGSNTESVGRKGDIWAFACIFSEVLTFALGQASAVSAFRSQRTGRHQNDYFYESVTSQHLRPNDDHHMYKVRAEVLEWLRKLVSDDQSPNRGIECCVSTILKMLVTDASQRPKAKQLVFMMNHVKTHISSDEMPVNSRNCPLNDHIVPPNIPTSPETPVELPASPADPGPETPSIRIDIATIPLIPVSGLVALPESTQTTHDGGTYQQVSPKKSVSGRSSLRGSLKEEPLSEPHKVIANPKTRRSAGSIKQFAMLDTRKAKVHDISLCPSGLHVAQLRSVPGSQTREVVVHDINLALGRCQRLPCVTLDPDQNWKHLVLSDDKLVVWGNTQDGQNIVCLKDGANELVTWIASSCAPLSSLLSISLSKNGCLAFVCAENVYYVKKDAYANLQPIAFNQEHSFTHASFNDNGTLLYAWAFSSPHDCLYIWRIDENSQDIAVPAESEGYYPSKRHGSPEAALIPYAVRPGCIVHAKSGELFPAQMRSTQCDSFEELPKHIFECPKVACACMYGDRSLFIVEKGTLHTRLWKHRVVGDSNLAIERGAKKPFAKWPSFSGTVKAIRVRPWPDSNDLAIVMCTSHGQVMAIPVEK